jgi:hypothetical protein
MSKSQRTKGAAFEREVCALFSSALGREVKRNIAQSRDGGYDIPVGPLRVECKRRKALGTVYGWLQQAIDATEAPAVPCVVARQDGDVVPLVILRLGDFLELTRGRL